MIYIIAWILCGLLAVYLAGKVDKTTSTTNNAPESMSLFIFGPIGLSVCILILSVLTLEKTNTDPLKKIRDLGRK
jgi:uncharacterized membrane protein YeaQ/YmgE (transglycosylase-associated protein family)